MTTTARSFLLTVLLALFSAGNAAAQAVPPGATTGTRCGLPSSHGPAASRRTFPSHVFQLAPRTHACPELAFQFGLLQPVLFHGANVAVDLRVGRFLLSYSHGSALDWSATPSLGLSESERRDGVALYSPYTTGGGFGVVLLDELYLMVDLKVHRYEASLGEDHAAYTTVSLGGELGYRLFLWRGMFSQLALRYWPNVYDTLGKKEAELGNHRLEAKNLGLFANLMVGWAFDP